MTDPTIDAIDHALTDWETSTDAMRWTPDQPPATPTLAQAFDQVLSQLLADIIDLPLDHEILLGITQHAGLTPEPWQHRLMYAMYCTGINRPTSSITITAT